MTSAFCSTIPLERAGSRSASPLFFSCAEKILLFQVVRKSLFMTCALLVRPPVRNVVALAGEDVIALKISTDKAIILIPSIPHGAGKAGIDVRPDTPNQVQIVTLFDLGCVRRLVQLYKIFIVELRAVGLNPGFPSGRHPLPFSVKSGLVERSPNFLCIVKVKEIAGLVNIRFGGSRNNYDGENNGKYH